MQDSLKSIWQRLTRKGSACERYETLVSLYADGMASKKEARLAEAHIAVCPECKALLSSIHATTGAFAEQPAPDLPTGLSERLRLAIAQERLREQELAPTPGRRTPARALAPRLALAGTLACAVIVAALVHDIRSSSQNGGPTVQPIKVAGAPRTKSAAPATHGMLVVSPPSAKVASSAGEDNKLAGAPAISHRSSRNGYEPTSPTRSEVAMGSGEAIPPHLNSVIDHHPTAHSSQTSHPQMAANSSSPSGGSGLTKAHKSTGVQVAKIPTAPIIPDVRSDAHQSLPPAVNNSTIGEQPIVVAAAPQPQPTPAAPEDTPRVRLASRLHLIADNSAQAVQQMAKVAVNNPRQTEYSGSLAIVGSSIR